ncbi:YesL family protein [Jiangella alba]|uniref:YesL family protein n=1 Tax=Jiangella alba TaxID=561176 RepID=UPI00083EFA45|nr:YesL family protein [Jiangella alba]
MEVGGRFRTLYAHLDWPPRLVLLNAMWVLGVLAGGVIAGLAPSTVALYATLRAYLHDGEDPSVWRTFWSHWRHEFARSQVTLGVPVLTTWVIAFYAQAGRGHPVMVGLTLLGLGYCATLIQLPAIVAHFELAPHRAWWATVQVAWHRPWATLGLVGAAFLAVAGAILLVPPAVPLLVPAVPALLATIAVRRSLSAAGLA